MALQGRFFDGQTSTAHPVEVTLHEDGSILVAGAGFQYDSHLRRTRVSERIGNTPRRFAFDDGPVCELADNEAIDAWLRKLDAHSAEHGVFQLERKWSYALGALVVTLAIALAFVRYGIPAIASSVARALPVEVDRAIGEGGLEALDDMLLEPTKLPDGRRAHLAAEFSRMTANIDPEFRFRLEFRDGGLLGANALALPSGIVVMTDQLVELAERDEEIYAVFAHEIGHVVHRHSLRMLLQAGGTAALMFGLLGDVGSVSTIAASVPTVLAQAKHSRDFEREADDYSYTWLRSNGISTEYFGTLLKRLEAQHGGDSSNGFASYFSSHPRTDERVRE